MPIESQRLPGPARQRRPGPRGDRRRGPGRAQLARHRRAVQGRGAGPLVSGERGADTDAEARGAVGSARSSALRYPAHRRSEEHTSELQSLMRISYAVFCLKKKKLSIIKTKCKDR